MTEQPPAPAPDPWSAPPRTDGPASADPWGPSAPGAPGAAAAPYGQAPYGSAPYGSAPYGSAPYGSAPYGGAPYGGAPVGRLRSTGTCVLLYVVTLGIYSFVYNFKVHREMQRHSGRGLGGGIALLLSIIAGVAMPFVTPSEVGAQYTRRGQRPPVSGWTGLWFVVPAVVGYLAFFVTLVLGAALTSGSTTDSSSGATVFVVVTLLAYVVLAGGGFLVWFVKTNGALNAYWRSVGAS